jgi:hypothetical protein
METPGRLVEECQGRSADREAGAMRRRWWLGVAVAGLALVAGGPAQAGADDEAPAAGPKLPAMSEREAHSLAGTFRALLVEHAPHVLYETWPGWGRTDRVARGLKWTGKHPLRPDVTYKDKNDGTWRHLRATADNLADTLVFDIRHVRNPQPGRMTFDVFVSFDAHVEYEQQNWDSGTRLYSGSARARLRVKLLLACEATTRVEASGGLLPDAYFRLRVTRADLGYDNLVVEHVAGVGGEAAKVLGDTVKGGLREFRPALERDLLARADAAIVKAGDTKEVRLSLANLFNQERLAGPALDLITGHGKK